jgi:hypothetical protein
VAPQAQTEFDVVLFWVYFGAPQPGVVADAASARLGDTKLPQSLSESDVKYRARPLFLFLRPYNEVE